MPTCSRILLSLLVVALAHPEDVAAQLAAIRVASGLTQPTWVTAPLGDAERLFILERPGRIRILKQGVVLARPFLDLTAAVNASGAEQGLLGLVFPSDYDTNGLFYVYYTGGVGAGFSHVQRFSVSGDPDSADAASAHTILQLTQPTPSHNGGHIEFGPDGYLYLGLGDGGSPADPGVRAQDPQELFGKLLRIDVDGDDFPADSLRNYAIPPTNPFADSTGVLDEIWALGLRNPYRFSFDSDTGDLYLGDVGHYCHEEIDYQPASSPGGENYGWNVMEGDQCWDGENPFTCFPSISCDDSSFTPPIHTYLHVPPGSCYSVVAGRVYRGDALPELQGHFFFTDYCSGRLWTFRYENGSVTQFTDWTDELPPPPQRIDFPSAIGRDGVGELYVTDWCCGTNGEVFKIVPAGLVDAAIGPHTSAALELRGDPNPFRGETRFTVRFEGSEDVTVSVYSAGGRLVRRLHQGPAPASPFTRVWDGRDAEGAPLAAGVYFVRAEAGAHVATRRITLLR